MPIKDIRERDFEREWTFTASRSSGPGGQHVNKVSTRIELRLNLKNSLLFNEEEKERIRASLGRYMNKEGVLILVSQSERSQYRNKKKAIERFFKLVQRALAPVKPRKASQPTAASRKRRIETKKLHSEKKMLRKIDPYNNE
jgi:ribosome-associated protein